MPLMERSDDLENANGLEKVRVLKNVEIQEKAQAGRVRYSDLQESVDDGGVEGDNMPPPALLVPSHH